MSRLTKTAIDRLQTPATGDAWLWCSELPGFGVRVQASGRKVYVARYRTSSGQQRKQVVARCCDMPPEKARELARKLFAQVTDGADPLGQRRRERTAPTIEALFSAYVASMKGKGRASAGEVERVLLLAKANMADTLGRSTLAADVTPGQIADVLGKIYRTGTRGAADKARSYIASAFSWAIKSANDYTVPDRQEWGLARNPVLDVRKDPGAIGTRDRNLSAEELRALWLATENEIGGDVADLIRLLICCGQRVQETLRIDGADLDLDAALWTMPAHKTKGRKHPHEIPLPRQALPILRRLKAKRGEGPLFPARKGSKSALISHRSVNQALGRWIDLETNTIMDFQSRDLRRTWKSRAHDAGVDRFTRDLIQQHAKHDTGSRNYDRAEYLPQKREAMKRWADWLAVTVEPKDRRKLKIVV